MKYVCEKCGKVFDEYIDASSCESSHKDWEFFRYNRGCALDKELADKYEFKPGEVWPRVLPLEVQYTEYEQQGDKYVDITYHKVFLYKLIKELPEDEVQDLEAKAAIRAAEEKRQWDKWEEERQAKRAAKEAEEKAAAEAAEESV